MTTTFAELRAADVPVTRSCRLIGRARATHYRHVRGPMLGPRPVRAVPGLYEPLTWSGKDWAIDVVDKVVQATATGVVYDRVLAPR